MYLPAAGSSFTTIVAPLTSRLFATSMDVPLKSNLNTHASVRVVEVDTSWTNGRVVAALEQLVRERGAPSISVVKRLGVRLAIDGRLVS